LQICHGGEAVTPATKGVLVVEVTSGTANGADVAGDEVTVGIYENNQPLQSLKGKIAADGKAVFDDMPLGDKLVALARVRHQDMMFNGQPIVLSPTEDKHIARVQVFDVSHDKSKLSIETHHIIIKALSTFLEISEYMQLKNSSDMAVSSKEKDAENREVILEIMLPKGFENLKSTSYFQDAALVVTEQGFYDTMAVPPGEFAVNFSYTLDITSSTMNIAKGISLPTSNLIVFAELGQAKLKGLGKADNKLITSSGTPMEYYKLSDLTATEEIAFQITGFNVNTSGFSTWIILSVTFGALVVFVFLRLLRRGACS
jgi:hypothetical protein